MSARPDLLELLLSPEIVAALDERVRELAAAAVRDELARRERSRRWVTIAEAAETLGCSADAVRMRVKRKTLDARRQGRRVYVRLHDDDREDGGTLR